ncbi:hypothetical protein LMG26690_02324 [Achromobacter animicus]|uniref:Isochorismatase-like domain-containing protein n=1 Tax=Achromobacter animicus TaxID=1389935 RepID=A0A6S6ZT11_9BURK|nr:hypothetical protein LMG26690_02324 [Achromobacter animicus]
MLLSASDSTLLIVDMQGRLMPVIHEGDAVLNAAHKLAQAARLLDVPVVATEHHSKMLGVTVDPLRELVQATFQKMHFSSAREPGFDGWLPASRKTVLVAGCEAHICVLQTVIGLVHLGYKTVLVADAAGSRKPSDHHAALRCAARARMARRSSRQRWRFSSGWRRASTRASATCYVWSNSRRPLQHRSQGSAKVRSPFDTIPG